MKSWVKRKKIHKLILQWDHKAQLNSQIKERAHLDYDKQRSLEEYFNFLDEIKPHIHELRQTKMFDIPFFLV